MQLSDKAAGIVFMTAWVGLPSLIWLRGVWKDHAPDRWCALALFWVFGAVAVYIDGSTDPLNTAGYWVMGLGLLTMPLGCVSKSIKATDSVKCGLLCLLCGLLMGMVI